jgi:PadR family transcriptional regulator PadR
MLMDGKQLETVANLKLEMRRGAIVLAVLSRMGTEEYGYSLKRALAEQGLQIDEGTLYPLLRRLESQGLLESDWRVEDGRPRRYYRSSVRGAEALAELRRDWIELADAMRRLLS